VRIGIAVALLTGIALTAGARAAAPQNPAPPVIAQIGDLVSAKAQGQTCNWLLPFDEIALNGKIADQVARVRLNFSAANARVAETVATSKPKTASCDSAQDRQQQFLVALLRLEWLVRADALYNASEAQPFAKNITSLGTTQSLRKLEYDRLRAAFVKNSGEAAWTPVYAEIVDDARRAIDLVCQERRAFATLAPRKCPIIIAADKKYIPVASAQVNSAEAFAEAYQDAARAVLAVSRADASDRSKLWKAMARTAPGAITGRVPCDAGDKVAAFDGPRSQRSRDRAGNAVVIAPIIAFGNPVELGTVTVTANGLDYVLLNADDKAKAAGVDTAMVFKRCAAG
jgi:hypothetical protein